jgi:lipoprotein-anchoring transpeptidase ErfK/SrfK
MRSHHSAWIQRDAATITRTGYWVKVQRATRWVTIYSDGRQIRRFRAVVGAPATPTPLGLAAIYERVRQPNPRAFLGPWALHLTVLSDVLDNFGAGPGRVAIHGRAGASLADPLGTARSHGCIRVNNDDVSWMASHLPAGTPVHITRR